MVWSRKQIHVFEFSFINSKLMIKIELTSSIFVLKILKSKQNFDFEIEFQLEIKNVFRNRKFISS